MSDDVPEGWRVAKLGEIAALSGGTTPSKTNDAYWLEGTVPWATPSDITSLPLGQTRIAATEGHVAELALKECSLKLNAPNTVLMTSRATIGYAVINDVPMATNQGFLNFTCSDECDPEFLCQWLNSNRGMLTAAAGGSTFKELSRGTAKLLPMLIPPLDEQQRIAEVLRSVDEAYSRAVHVSDQCLVTRNEIIDQLLRSGMRTRAPGASAQWDKVRLGDVLSIKHGFAFSSEFFRSEDTGTILLTPGNFSVSKRLYFGPNTKFYDGPIPEGYILKNGDLLLVMTDLTQDMAILGNAVTLDAPARVLHNQRIGKVSCDTSRVVADFARLLLNSPGVQSKVKASASGSTVRHTSPGKILETEVKLPPLEEQREIVSFAHSLDRSFGAGALIAAPMMRGMVRGALHEMTASLRTDLLSGRVRVPA